MATKNQYLRFTLPLRIEHWVLTISFTILAITGLPQKFAGNNIAETAIAMMGGIETVRLIHHTSAIIMLLVSIYHVLIVGYKVVVLRVRMSMLPTLKDAVDMWDTVRYNLGLSKKEPEYDWYNFIEKLEYWAVVWGTVIMALTGFILWNPISTTSILPGEIIPASKAAHGAEAVLAVLAILLWHTWSVHFRTFNKAVFTGMLTEHQMAEEHGLELRRIKSGNLPPKVAREVIEGRARFYIPIATLAGVIMVALVYLLATAENTAIATVPLDGTVKVFAPLPATATVPLPTPTATATLKPGATVAPTSAAPAGVAKPLLADHAGRTICLACHTTLTSPALPADHAGRTDATCTACHKLGTTTTAPSTAAPTSAPTGAKTSAPTSAAPAATTTTPPTTGAPASGVPAAIPADHVGRTICVACHGAMTNPAMPADHAGRTDATCTACHKAASAPSAPATAVPATAPATSVATTAPTAKPTLAATATTVPTGAAASSGTPAPIPADHVGRTICLACHTAVVQPTVPPDHAGRTDATCTACHAPLSAPSAATSAPAGATVVPTKVATVAPTLAATVVPTTQPTAATTATTAASGSSTTTAAAKAIPADHVGRTVCLACHTAVVQPTVPADHAGRTDATCTACHKSQ